jgi:hypothetical protein
MPIVRREVIHFIHPSFKINVGMVNVTKMNHVNRAFMTVDLAVRNPPITFLFLFYFNY